MTIEILYSVLVEDELIEGASAWVCWLEIEQLGQVWMLPATAPGTLAESELQSHFDGREDELWQIADAKQYALDIYGRLEPRRVLKAFAGVMLDEINILRQQHGLALRTVEQLRDAVKGKLL